MNRHILMDRSKFFIRTALGLVLLLSIVLITGAAQGVPPIQATTFLYEPVRVLDPGRVWTDQTGTHIRNRVDLGVLSGDIRGNAIVVYNADLPTTSEFAEDAPPEPVFGLAYGTIRIYPSGEKAAQPMWEGTWEYQLRGREVVSGFLTATNSDNTRVLIIESVQQLHKEVLELSGYIDYLFCPTASCDPVPENR